MGPILTRSSPSTRFGSGGPIKDTPGRQAATAAISANIAKHLFGRLRHRELLIERVGRRKISDDRDWNCGFECPSLGRPRHARAGIFIVDGMARPHGPETLAAPIQLRRNASRAALRDDRLNGANDSDIAGAAAEIAAHPDPDLALISLRQPQHQVAGGHQHSRRAIAALQCVLAGERRAQLDGDLVVVEPLDRGDLRARASRGIGDAGSCRHTVQQDGAGPADAVLAAEMRSREVELVADEVRKICPRLGARCTERRLTVSASVLMRPPGSHA